MKHNIITLLKKIGAYRFIRKALFFCVTFYYSIRKQLQSLFYKRKATVLLYHRIADVSSDPTFLCVTSQTFEKHLLFYKKNYDVISLAKLIEKVRLRKLNGSELALTFDDGYQDNLLNALPLLERYNIPATIFITTAKLGNIADFDWDKKYADKDRARFLSPEEIRTLSNHPLITIGAHTVNHVKLGVATDDTVLNELNESKKVLESIIDSPINFFAYPFGGPLDFTKSNEEMVTKVGFSAALANDQLFVTHHSRLTAIPRINIRDYTIKELVTILK